MIKLDATAPAGLPDSVAPDFSQATVRSNWAHIASLALYICLLMLFSLHQWFRAEGISLFQWAVQCGPLLIFWFGLRKRHRRTYLWLCFVLLLYFIKGVEGVMGPTPDLFDSILLIASTSLFITSMMTARWQFLREKILYEHRDALQQGKHE